MIYLDNNATTAIDPEVARVLAEAFSQTPANASSQHRLGQQTRSRLEAATDQIGRCLGSDLSRVDAPRLLVTSGGTESNNLAIAGMGEPEGAIVVSRIEHPSVLAAAAAAEVGERGQSGRELGWVDVDANGVISLVSLRSTLDRLTRSGDSPEAVSVVS
ncbi:aminotransferase class V-fold PLP-dependent enzyme, partial [Rhodopirellula bahusiensis]